MMYDMKYPWRGKHTTGSRWAREEGPLVKSEYCATIAWGDDAPKDLSLDALNGLADERERNLKNIEDIYFEFARDVVENATGEGVPPEDSIWNWCNKEKSMDEWWDTYAFHGWCSYGHRNNDTINYVLCWLTVNAERWTHCSSNLREETLDGLFTGVCADLFSHIDKDDREAVEDKLVVAWPYIKNHCVGQDYYYNNDPVTGRPTWALLLYDYGCSDDCWQKVNDLGSEYNQSRHQLLRLKKMIAREENK